MRKRRLIPVCIGIIILISMFLMGQDGCMPECIDNDGDGYGDPASRGCKFFEPDCDDNDPLRNPGEAEGPFGHDSCSDGFDNDCNVVFDEADPKCDPDDLNVTAADFECLSNWTRGDIYFLINKRGYQAEAEQVAQDSINGISGTYPPGTIIQLVPTEAMVKRAPGWNPATNDWEFISLRASDDPLNPTTILKRGGTEISTFPFGNCFNCHNRAQPQWDLICRKTHGCNPLPFTDEFILNVQANDPRCQ